MWRLPSTEEIKRILRSNEFAGELEAIQYLLPLCFRGLMGVCLNPREELFQACRLRPSLDHLLKLLPALLDGLGHLAAVFLLTPPFLLRFPFLVPQFRLSLFLFDLFHNNGRE